MIQTMDFLVNPPGVAGNALFTARGGDPTVVIQAQEPRSNASLLTTNRQGNGDVHAPLTTVLALHAGNFIITDRLGVPLAARVLAVCV